MNFPENLCNVIKKNTKNRTIDLFKSYKTLWPLFMDGVQLPQGYSHFEEAVYQPRKDERLSRPWSHPVVLNTGLLD